MSTTVIPATSFYAVSVERSKAVDRWTPFELVKAFGDRVFSVAKHITQSDDDAEHVLIETFSEVCSDLDRRQESEKVWLRLVTIAVREAFSKLRNRGEGRRLLDQVADSSEDLVIREVSVWGENYQQHYSSDDTTCVLEQGLRSLDPMCRTLFVLRDIEDISVRHIAAIVNRSVAAVEICLLRARLQLREFLAAQMRVQQ
jgi:RNA polymerase sigma-70 factor (ECF subfamily)